MSNLVKYLSIAASLTRGELDVLSVLPLFISRRVTAL
jgi:hypothetical protein